jgi:hypothetical protein
MRADYTNKVLLTARGRDSIRIQSYAAYGDSVVVLDLTHMPEGARPNACPFVSSY